MATDPSDMPRIFRYEVPVDDQWHEHHCATPLAVAARSPYVVEFWAYERTDLNRQFRVIGTGQPEPEADLRHRGTAVTASGSLVWHLMERHPANVLQDKEQP
jgi:hypothetical protein